MNHFIKNFSVTDKISGEFTLEAYLPDFKLKHGESILICPGGGYGMVSDREAEVVALQYCKAGISAFVLTYSVAPNRYPCQINQVATVVKYIKDNSLKFGISADNMFIMGFSAGGHLACHYSVLSAKNHFETELGGNAEDYKISGAILCYPVITTDKCHWHQGSFDNLLAEKRDAMANEVSCEKLVTSSTPPMFIWHTYKDGLVPVKNSMLMANALIDNNVSVELHIYEKGDHGLSIANELVGVCQDDNISKRTQEWVDNSIEWLTEHSK